jgi:cytochrome o ubiquinol oxidase subunit I
MFGKLSLDAIPFSQPLPLVVAALIGLILAGVIVWVIACGANGSPASITSGSA